MTDRNYGTAAAGYLHGPVAIGQASGGGLDVNYRSAGRKLGSALLLGLLAVALAACGGRQRPEALVAPATITTIGINSYLWRAALETLNFMPLAQVDSNGGVIIGDWYRNPDVPDERMKLTVVILDGALRADAVQVTAERQVLREGAWRPAEVRAGTVQRLEEIILEKARTLRQRATAR